MSLISDILNRKAGPGIRRVVVAIAFVGIPVGVWWSATPMISKLPMSDDIRRLLMLSVLATLAFGLSAGVLVWRDLDREP